MTQPFPFETERHRDETGPSAVHQTDFYSTTDPASDPDNDVAAGKRWRKPDDLTTPTKYRIYVRNEANSAWILEGSWGIADYAVGQVPAADADGYLWPADVEGEESGEGGIAGVVVSAEGTPVGTRPEINFVMGENVTISVTDDPGNDRVNIGIDASAESGGGGGPHAPTHAEGGDDEVDVTTLGGFSGDADEVLHGDGTWAEPGGAVPQWITDLWSGHPDAYPVSPTAEDDEFAAGSLDAKWTNVAGATTAFASSRMTVTFVNASDAAFRQGYAPGASTAFTITAKFTGLTLFESTDYVGLLVLDSSNAVIASCDYRYGSALHAFNKDAPGSANNLAEKTADPDVYVKISRDASNNYQWSWSFDGLGWSAPNAAVSSATTVAKIGFRFGQTQSRAYKRGSIDWFRRST